MRTRSWLRIPVSKMKRLPCLTGMAAWMCAAFLCMSMQTAKAADADAKTILLLNPSDVLSPGAQTIDRAIFDVLDSAKQKITVLSEQAIAATDPPDELENDTLALLEKKYRNKRIDLILVRGEHALDFIERHGDRLWRNVPAMYFSISDTSRYWSRRPAGRSGVFIGHDFAGNLDVILRLQPSVQHIVQIAESAGPNEMRGMQNELMTLIGQTKKNISVEILPQMPLPELIDKVKTLPEHSALLAMSINGDRDGVLHATGGIVQALSLNANAPLYGMRNSYLGNGAVGGQVIDLPAHGRQVAEMALARLAAPDAPPTVQVTHATVCSVDDRQLRRWQMRFGALGGQCKRLFHVPAFWDENGRQIITAFCVLALVLTLLFLLNLQRRKRIRADEETIRQRTALAHVARLGSVGELTASIVHEINQPLGAILANADAATMMLSRHSPSDNELKAILADIREDNLRASQIIQKLRTLLSKRSLESIPLSINDVVNGSKSLLGNLAIRHQTTLQIRQQDDLPLIMGDTTHLQQVLINLSANAMEAMSELAPDKRLLTISTGTDGTGNVLLLVSDCGPGIATDVLPNIFDAFYTTKAEGMGMGLSIVQTIVEAHHGHIRVINNMNGGATFRVTIPESKTCNPRH